MFIEILVLAAAVLAYVDRTKLKNKLIATEAALESKATAVENDVKAKARADIAAVVSEIKFSLSKGATLAVTDALSKVEDAVKKAL